MQRLSTQPYKGARDFYPYDMRIQNYIFDTWKKACKSFGFEEYSFPIIEPFEIFAAKTGAEIVNEQLYNFEDKGGRRLAVRPELTPGTVRMIAQRYKELPQPIKWFMIGNNWRFEKPQTGRGREFYQLETNIFGVNGVEADIEIFSLILEIMRSFGAKEGMYTIKLSDRRLVSELLGKTLGLPANEHSVIRRMMDKKDKLTQDEFNSYLEQIGVSNKNITLINKFMEGDIDNLPVGKDNPGLIGIKQILEFFTNTGFSSFFKFDPGIIRGFDYSDGLVYEVFDNNPSNKRSLFGGERFDRLIQIFSDANLPSTGFAMGDYTLLEFLKGWDLLPDLGSTCDYLVTVWPSDNLEYLSKAILLSNDLRSKGFSATVWTGINNKLEKQLRYADKMNYANAVIFGPEELVKGCYKVKNLKTKEETTVDVSK